MPKFLTISPTHIPGKKEYAWANCLRGGYVAIGWMHEDLAGKPWSEVETCIHSHHYPNEVSAIDSFRKLLALRPGDHVGVNNGNHGLFGIGVVTSGYRYQDRHHDTGADDRDRWYSHLVGVKWEKTTYIRRRDLVHEGEKGWAPYGTVGALVDEIPEYILRALGRAQPDPDSPPNSDRPDYVRPDWLAPLLSGIHALRRDIGHQERAHESLVEDFLVALGYRKHEDIKYRQGRLDITLEVNGKPIALFEVKRDWELDHTRFDVVRQAYNYALEKGVRHLAITNGDYYLLIDRLKGLSYEANIVGEFNLTTLQDDDLELVESLRRDRLKTNDVRNVLMTLAECF